VSAALPPSWLVFLFRLPSKQASGRVDVWRRLKKTGAIALPSGGHVLPDTPDEREQFDGTLAALEAGLDRTELEAARARGAAMTLDAAVDFAMRL